MGSRRIGISKALYRKINYFFNLCNRLATEDPMKKLSVLRKLVSVFFSALDTARTIGENAVDGA
jgi:hypothetical protein